MLLKRCFFVVFICFSVALFADEASVASLPVTSLYLASNATPIQKNCTCKGVALYGKVKVVTSFADFDVQVVESFADIEVQTVKSFPDKCGKWKFVDAFPDFTIRFVSSFPDFKIKYVTSFPGVK
jgi:hypothetical protein